MGFGGLEVRIVIHLPVDIQEPQFKRPQVKSNIDTEFSMRSNTDTDASNFLLHHLLLKSALISNAMC
jgi:hypothetical protein